MMYRLFGWLAILGIASGLGDIASVTVFGQHPDRFSYVIVSASVSGWALTSFLWFRTADRYRKGRG